MAVCEKCWRDAGRMAFNNPEKSQTEYYHQLLEIRKEYPCSEKEQKGEMEYGNTL